MEFANYVQTLMKLHQCRFGAGISRKIFGTSSAKSTPDTDDGWFLCLAAAYKAVGCGSRRWGQAGQVDFYFSPPILHVYIFDYVKLYDAGIVD